MRMSSLSRVALVLAGISLFGLVAGFSTYRLAAQDPDAKPTYGEKELKAGFEPDPFRVKVDAGGNIKTDKGGVNAYVAKEPDFRLVYTAGEFPLTFLVKSKADTTLLINTPDGKWLANDDSGDKENPLNPKVTIAQPKSGRYEIWVGMLNGKETPPAELLITELIVK